MIVDTRQFARTFAEARARFLAAAAGAGATISEYRHPLLGPDGEVLATDVARIGARAAEHLLVLITGVHGVEHFVGSACVSEWLEGEGPGSLPENMAMVIIHAINPWGAAYSRRYTEDNVDLARNFSAPGEELPAHKAYEAIHEELTALSPAAIPGFLDRLFSRLGEREAIRALMSGQYRHADGFSFGGRSPVWSHQTIESILRREAGDAKSVCLVEYHSGLGPWGFGMVVTMQSGDDLDRVQRFFGPEIVAPRVDEGLHGASGHTSDGYMRFLAGKTVTSIVLEFGTYPPQRSLPVLLEDHWLNRQRNPDRNEVKRIRTANLEMHCPASPAWEEQVLTRSRQIITQAILGLSSS